MPWQGYNVVPLHAATQLLKLQRLVKKALPGIKNDTLIFQGKKDMTINPAGTIQTYNLLGSMNKRLIWLEESPHCILLGGDLALVEEICGKEISELETTDIRI